MDFSPTSPGAASDLSEIFEPPKANSGSVPGSAKKARKGARGGGVLCTIGVIPTVPERITFATTGKGKKASSSKPSKSVQMKLIDDKLRIIDDVPTSAVEMAVKEKVHFNILQQLPVQPVRPHSTFFNISVPEKSPEAGEDRRGD